MLNKSLIDKLNFVLKQVELRQNIFSLIFLQIYFCRVSSHLGTYFYQTSLDWVVELENSILYYHICFL